jgi:hypothetical protein
MIPTQTKFTVDRGTTGVVAWAVQRGLNERGFDAKKLVEDGVYGPETQKIVTNFQKRQRVFMDGRFGPKTSERLARVLSTRLEVRLPALILSSMVLNESNFYIAAVNWSVAGGVDCGYCQRRVYTGSLEDQAVVRRAFDPLYQFKLLAASLVDRYEAFFGEVGATTHERAWRLAALNHNWPYAAARLAHGYTLSDKAAPWVPKGTRFKDGTPVVTYLDWAKFYALGAPEHNHYGVAVSLVKNWTT